jgi:hypothetical protein
MMVWPSGEEISQRTPAVQTASTLRALAPVRSFCTIAMVASLYCVDRGGCGPTDLLVIF